ncbi:MAG: hypothetical protein D6720_13045 [Gammaproteobacteria bacterium]|nr:MAG: hypothetical protein D6720_13045 [Gammaproteobacteria bacterium]
MTVKEVSSQALAAVYRGEIRDWAMLGGVPHKIRLIHREKGDSCRRRLEADLPELFPAEGGPPAMTTVTTQATLRAVREYPGALAYGPYPEVLGREYRVLELDGVAPDEPRYPLRNRLYFVWSADVPLSPQAQAFLAFIRSERGQEIIRARGANPVEGENLP